MESIFQCYSLLNMKVIGVYYLVLIKPRSLRAAVYTFPII